MTKVCFEQYQIEIPDALMLPFRSLATILAGGEIEDVHSILRRDPGRKLLQTSNQHVVAAIGKCFAYDIKLREVLSAWEELDFDCRLEAIFEAARSTEPIDLFKQSVNQDV